MDDSDFRPMNSIQINQNRKLISLILQKISNDKDIMTMEEMEKKVLVILKENSKDITTIYDEEKNNFVHLLVMDERLDSLKIIVNAYYLDLDKEPFYHWFTDENSSRLTPLDVAAQKGNRDIIKFLWEKIAKTDEKILRLHEKRNSFFHYAAQKNQVFPILFFYEKLQKYFPNEKIIDMPNENLITPLHYACYSNSLKVVDILLDLGANINAQDCNDKTVLSYAICSGSIRLVKKLLLRGANKYLYDDKHKTAYDFAIEKKKADIANLLKPKNWFLKTFCNSLELSSIKGLRNDFRTAYFFIFYYLFLSYSLLFLTNNHENNIQVLEIIAMIVMSLGVFAISIAFLFLVYFSVFFKREKNKKRAKHDGLLTDLYKEGEDICIKCYKRITDNSTHCIACDVCIEEWDHHCFWLNICIDIHMKTQFIIFFYSFFIGALFNCLFGIIEIIYCAIDINNHHHELIIWCCFTGALIYTFCFILLPLCCCFIMKKNMEVNKTTLTEYETNFLNRSRDKSSYDNN